jgi:hypothetical protein
VRPRQRHIGIRPHNHEALLTLALAALWRLLRRQSAALGLAHYAILRSPQLLPAYKYT